MSVAQLAEKSGVASRLILAYEDEGTDRTPDPQRLRALADALSVSPLELVVDEGKDAWTLAQLRRACGWRAQDMSRDLGVALRNYRRVETEGLVYAKHFGLLDQMARLLGTDVEELDHHLNNATAVQERLSVTRWEIGELLDRYTAPGVLNLPAVDDVEVVALAERFERPVSSLTRILGYEVVQIRRAKRRLITFSAAAHYGTSVAEQSSARSAAHEQEEHLAGVRRSLPGRLESFFRRQLPSESWHALAVLHIARRYGLRLAPQQLGITMDAIASLPTTLWLPPSPSVRRGPQVTSEGAAYVVRFRPWYDALYPAVASMLLETESYFSGFVSSAELQERFQTAEAILFSFDGLLCRLFGSALQAVSDQLVQAALSIHLSIGTNTPTDPVGMLRYVVRQGTATQIRRLDYLLTAQEMEAARTAQPLPGVDGLFRTLTAGPWRLAVVTDHSSDAVEIFLDNMVPLSGHRRVEVFGRSADPRLMKPNPHGVTLAASALGSSPSRVLLVGESVADALAAQAAGVTFVGVASTRQKARMLRAAGAKITVRSLKDITAVAATAFKTAAIPPGADQ
ncbi:HAD family hydrolase [Streptomyces sp. NPDC059445]|uniref:HAD family hydrolase n=1 Tax=Streptomyces sp. NPDC059445 TaxID=3346832 RepID=UPI00369BD91B